MITVEEADTYFSTRLRVDAWNQALAANRVKAIFMATEIVDRLVMEEYTSGEYPVDYPIDLKDAVCEITLKLLDGFDIEQAQNDLRIQSEKAGGVVTTYNSERKEHIFRGVPSLIAWRLMRAYMDDPSTVRMDRVS